MQYMPGLGPPARPDGQDEVDPKLQETIERLRKQRDAEMGVTVLRAAPEKAGRANALSRRHGVPATLVESDIDYFEARDRHDKFMSVMDQYEVIASWAADKRNAAAASDDADNLGLLGNIWRHVGNVGGSLVAGAKTGVAGYDEVVAGILGGIADVGERSYADPNSLTNRLGLGEFDRAIAAPVVDLLRSGQQLYEREAAGMRAEATPYRPEARSPIEQGLYAGFESIPTTLSGIAVGLVTRNPTAAASVMGLTVTGNEYREALDAGINPNRAARYALSQGAVEVLTERIPASRLIGDLATKSPVAKTFMRQLTAELPGEQVATIVQDLNEWANLNPDKPFMDYVRERPEAALQTALATISGVGGVVAITKATEKTAGAGARMVDRIGKARAAAREGRILDDLAEASSQSKMKERDPQAFAELMRAMGANAGVRHVFIDGAAAREFMQSDSYDGSLDPWAEDIDDAVAADGDFAIGIEDAFTDLAGKPAWDALRPDMRLSPDGMSQREAEAFDEGAADVMAEFSDAAPAASADPRTRLFESVSTKLMHAGFTPTTARTQAELLASRYATRAERMGQELTGNEFDSIEVAQILPEALSRVRNASEVEPDAGLMAVIDEMQRRRGTRSDRARYGPSLVEFISQAGGVQDLGGDLASMGAGPVRGFAQRGQKKIIGEANTLDDMALRAWEAGYFPEFTERPTVNDLLDAIDEGLRDNPRYSQDNERESEDDDVRQAAEELRGLLTNMGIDPDTATAAEIKTAVDQFVAEQEGGLRFDQTTAFRNWAGTDAPVIEPDEINDFDFSGEGPFVMRGYHGTTHDFEAFNASVRGTKEGQFGAVNYFSSSEADATDNYAGEGPDLTNRIERRAEELADLMEIDFEKARSAARSELAGGQPRTLEVFIRTEKPFVVGDESSPWIEFTDFEALERQAIEQVADAEGISIQEVESNRDEYEDAIDEARWEIESDTPNALFEAVESVARRYDVDGQDLYGQIADMAVEGARHGDLEKALREAEALAYAEDPETGDLVGYHMLGEIIQELGFDSIILKNAGDRFKTMDVEFGTAHIHIFDRHNANIKSVENRGTFDPNDPRILYQPAFHGSSEQFERFAREKIGSSGVSKFGFGFYFGDREDIAREYATDGGALFTVEIPEDRDLIKWDADISDQPFTVGELVEAMDKDGDVDALIEQFEEHEDAPFSADADDLVRRYVEVGDGRARDDLTDWGDADLMERLDAVRNKFEIAFDDSTGGDVYELVAGTLGSQEAASSLFFEIGVKGVKAEDKTLKDGGFNFVVFDESDIKIISREPVSIRAYEQTYGEGPRGRIVFPDSAFAGSARIELFKARNLSTFLHESGHLFLEELRFDAEQTVDTDGNPMARQTFADWETVKAWFKANGHEIGEDGVIPTEAHEMWARGFERFLMEGKAPSQSLRRAFEAFKTWLVNIYRSVARLDSPITDEIRGVMARLIATDTEIAEAAEQQEIELIFSSAVEAGMGESAFRALQEAARDARANANDELLKRVMAPIRARVTKEYKEREKSVRAEVAEGVDNRPIFRAMRLLKETPMDSAWLDERDVTGLPPQVPPVSKRDGANPADIAERAGFRSPEEMIDALRGLEIERKKLRANDDKRSVRNAIIDGETESIMLARYGDPFTDGSIEEEALALIHNDAHGEVMAAELRALGRKSGRRATPYRIARNWARERIRGGLVNETTSRSAIQRYQRSAKKAGRAAMDAMMAGDRDEAFRHKQSQMLNNALVAEAKAALDEVEAAVNRMEKLAKRRTLKSTDQDYLEQAQALLEAVEFRPRSQISLNRQGKFEEWARAQEAAGIDIVVPPSFEASLGTVHWSRLTVEKLLGLDAATKQIMHLGRMKQKLVDAKEQREFDAVVKEATDGMGGLPQKPPSDLMEPGWWDAVKSRVAAWDVALLKAEQVFDWLDGGNENGVFNRIVFRPIADAQSREMDMMAEYSGKIREAFKRVDKKLLSRWSEPFSDPRLVNRETGNPYQMKREQLIAMALNMGNEGNIQRLADGYGWSEGAIREVLNRELSAQEWQFVQEIWDTIDGLWPDIAALERRVNGVAPDKVQAVPVETPHGVFRGGYYPAIYDQSKDYDAERQAEKASDLFEMNYTRATTRARSTKDRAEQVKRPILLQLGVINRHIGEVIHDISHREAVMQAHKFLNDRRIKKAVDDTLGPEYRKMFQPWLKYIANQWAQERAGADGIGQFMRKLRANTTVVGMGFRITTIIQQIAGYSNSFEKVGAKWMTPAIAQTAAHPIETFRFVMERSGEVRHRMDTIDRDIRLTLRDMAGKGNPITAAKRFAFHGIGYTDRIVVIPTWIAAYNKALAAGAAEDAAIHAGDKAVRLSQGAAGAKDLAAVATGQGRYGELMKLMTMFYSYLSAVYSRQRTLGRDISKAKPRDIPGLMARAWWLVILPPMLAELLSGRGPEEDEDWGMWAFSAITLQMFGAIPIVRDAARPIVAEITGQFAFKYSLSPVQRGIETAVSSFGDAVDIVRGEETTRATRNALETVGYFTGLVPGQVAQSTQFLVDVAEGEQDPRDFWDWYEGLTRGRISDD